MQFFSRWVGVAWLAGFAGAGLATGIWTDPSLRHQTLVGLQDVLGLPIQSSDIRPVTVSFLDRQAQFDTRPAPVALANPTALAEVDSPEQDDGRRARTHPSGPVGVTTHSPREMLAAVSTQAEPDPPPLPPRAPDVPVPPSGAWPAALPRAAAALDRLTASDLDLAEAEAEFAQAQALAQAVAAGNYANFVTYDDTLGQRCGTPKRLANCQSLSPADKALLDGEVHKQVEEARKSVLKAKARRDALARMPQSSQHDSLIDTQDVSPQGWPQRSGFVPRFRQTGG